MWLDDFRYRTEWNAYANRRRYDCPADPWAFVRVDPAEVELFNVVSLLWGLGRVRGGEWDQKKNCRRIDETSLYEGLIERFEHDCDWEDTRYYETAIERISDDGEYREYENEAELRAEFFPSLDELYEDMRENGYRPNRGTIYTEPEDADYIHELDPLILVGRDGDLIWSEGYHRLVLARILNIDSIPVYVLRRHEEWQQHRDRLYNADGTLSEFTEYTAHPDLQDVLAEQRVVE